MLLEEKSEFKFEDLSKNLFSNINLVNNLTLKEIQKLNEKYKELGLYIKQVRVDKYANEKSPNDIIQKNYLSKKRILKRHSKMTVEQLYYKYFCYDSFSKREKNNKNKNIDSSFEDYQYFNIEDLKDLRAQLKEAHDDFNNLIIKKCKIKKPEFKNIIINYIQKYNVYLESNQYLDIYNKWREKAMLLPGINLNNIDDLSEWSIPLLKEFKAEIEINAITNIINKKIKEEEGDESEEKEKENNNLMKKRIISSSSSDSELDSESEKSIDN